VEPWKEIWDTDSTRIVVLPGSSILVLYL